MSYEIERGHVECLMGVSNPEQLKDWLSSNPLVVGVCFLGRSNVGKSTLINSIFGKGTARTSKTPGRTREINIFRFNLLSSDKDDPKISFFLFDVPGYGHAEVSKQMSKNWNTLMSIFFELTTKNVSLVNLQDARHPNQKADKEFHKFLKNFDFDTTLVFNKMDKLKKQKDRAVLNKLKPQLFKEYKWVKLIHFVSAEKNQGTKELHDSIVTNLTKFID